MHATWLPNRFFEILQELAPEERENLTGVLTVLSGNPLAYLIQDSYRRYLAGEVIAPLDQAAESSNSEAVELHDESADQEQIEGEDQPADVSTEAELPVAESAATAVSASASAGMSAVPIQSRTAVMDALNQVEAYFLRSEPASPIPLIITEVRQLIPKKFIDLVAELKHVLSPESGESSE